MAGKVEDSPDVCISIGRSLSILHRFSHSFMDNELKDYSLNKVTMEIIIILYRAAVPMNQTEINKFFCFNKATMTKLITRLEESGYVRREQSTVDRREKVISLTGKAWDLEETIKKILDKQEEIFESVLGKEYRPLVREQLYNLAEVLKDHHI